MNGVFLLATDTGVGKTLASAALVAALRARGVNAGYMKPVGSDGLPEAGRLVSPDALFVARTTGLDDPFEWINPICLPGAVSPLAATEESGLDPDLALIGPAFQNLLERHDFLVVEGVGGLLSPVTADQTAVDLIPLFGFPALVAARPALGTINHTLLTLEALERRGLSALGFFYSQADPAALDPSRPTNARHTGLFTRVPFLGTLPFIPQKPEPSAEVLAQAGNILAEKVMRGR
jgi:dethiobiotin synthetase